MVSVAYDYSNFNPSGRYTPPEGSYQVQIVGADDTKKTKNGHRKIVVLLEVMDTAEAGNKFERDYAVGHPTPDASRIAYEGIAKLYWAATALKPDRTGLDLRKAFFKPFRLTVKHESHDYVDDKGEARKGKNIQLANILPLDPSGTQVTAAPQAIATSGQQKQPWES